MPSRSLHDLSLAELREELAELAPVHALTLWKALHREGETELRKRGDFPPPLQRWVADFVGPDRSFFLDHPEQSALVLSSDGLTRKFLLRLADGQTIETVLMKYSGRSTVCVSTQAGCAMGCVFCATGQMGFARHLRPGEIVAQVLHAVRDLRAAGEPELRNLVLMGMGEPLHNFDAVLSALQTLAEPRGLGLSPRRMTISTVGVVPGILRLAEERHPYNLAISLHGASQEERAALLPAARRWPIEELLAACRTYAERLKGRRIFFEWTLIAGTNDTPEIAERLTRLLHGLPAHVNLIPLNPTGAYAGLPSAGPAAETFSKILQSAGLPATIRQRRGIDVAAGCGQLRAEKARAVTRNFSDPDHAPWAAGDDFQTNAVSDRAIASGHRKENAG